MGPAVSFPYFRLKRKAHPLFVIPDVSLTITILKIRMFDNTEVKVKLKLKIKKCQTKFGFRHVERN